MEFQIQKVFAYKGNLGHSSVDCYSLSLSAASEVQIDWISSSDPHLFLIYGLFLDLSGKTRENDDYRGLGRNLRIIRALDPGTYTVAATTYRANATGSYTLRINTHR